MADQGRLYNTGGYYIAFIILGLVMALIGPTLPGLAEHTNSSLDKISWVFIAQSFGFLLGALAGGRLYDRMPGHPILIGILTLLALMLLLIPLIPFLWLLTIAIFVAGMAKSFIDVGGNTLLVWIHGRRVGPFMNGLHFCFGVGAFISPLIVAQVVKRTHDITWAYWLIAIIIIPVAVGFWFLPSPAAPRGVTGKGRGRVSPLLVGSISLFMFLYVGAEVSYGGWIYTYALKAKLADEVVAAYLTSAFWGALTVGRLLSIPLTSRFKPALLLFGNLAGCVLSVGVILFFPGSLRNLVIGTVGLGFFMAAIFPTTLSFGERRMTITATITSLLFVGASIGGMTWPWLIGQLLASQGPNLMMVMILGILISALVVLTGVYRAYPDASIVEIQEGESYEY